MPNVIFGGLINLAKGFFWWVDLVGCLLRSVTSDIAKEDLSVSQQLSELTIGDDQSTECSETFKRFIGMLFGSVFVNGGARDLGIAAIKLLGLPDEVLQQVALVLAEKKIFSLSNNFSEIGN